MSHSGLCPCCRPAGGGIGGPLAALAGSAVVLTMVLPVILVVLHALLITALVVASAAVVTGGTVAAVRAHQDSRAPAVVRATKTARAGVPGEEDGLRVIQATAVRLDVASPTQRQSRTKAAQ